VNPSTRAGLSSVYELARGGVPTSCVSQLPKCHRWPSLFQAADRCADCGDTFLIDERTAGFLAVGLLRSQRGVFLCLSS